MPARVRGVTAITALVNLCCFSTLSSCSFAERFVEHYINLRTRSPGSWLKPAETGDGLRELEEPANFTCDVAEDGRGRREGRAGTDEALRFEHNARHLPAVRAREPATSGRRTQPLSELNCDQL